MIEAFPLQWPIGYKRSKKRIESLFKQTPEAAQKYLCNEIKLLGATGLVVSSNVLAKKDGFLYTDMSKEPIEDPGIAIYFNLYDKAVSMCCDTYQRPWENLYALAKGIEGIRAIKRYGISEFIERAFTGFKELPQSTQVNNIMWWDILMVPKDSDKALIKSTHRLLIQRFHPDTPGTGNAEKFVQVQEAYKQAMGSFNQ